MYKKKKKYFCGRRSKDIKCIKIIVIYWEDNMVKVQCVQILQDTQSYTMRLTCLFFYLNIHENYFFVKSS